MRGVADDADNDLPDNGPTPIYAAVIDEIKALKSALRRLEDDVLLLMAQAGVTQQEIADELGITPQAVSKRQRRAANYRTVLLELRRPGDSR
jgi:DNA-directed RNA polymerase specialized sigma24 family protein